MIPETDPRTLSIDDNSIQWAWKLGWDAYKRLSGPGVRWDSYCPFRAGSPHRYQFMRGWKGLAI